MKSTLPDHERLTMNDTNENSLWQFWIDAGGTFTDFIGLAPDGMLHTRKVLSSGVVKGCIGAVSADYRVADSTLCQHADHFFDGYRFIIALPDDSQRNSKESRRFEATVCEHVSNTLTLTDTLPGWAVGSAYELISGEPAPVLGIRSILGIGLEQSIDDVVRRPDQTDSGPTPSCRVRLGTTRGTNALLERKGARVALVTTPGFADLSAIGTQARPKLFELDIQKPPLLAERVIEVDERIAANGDVLTPLVSRNAEELLNTAHCDGIDAVAICLLNAYANPSHEHAIRDIAESVGFSQVSVSTDLTPTIKMLDRCDTAVVDAYLSPVIRDYIKQVRSSMPRASLKLMTSSGGLVDADNFAGKDSILSGPAGGVVGFSGAAKQAGFERAIGFDMGGTSTDVSRFDGDYDYQFTAEKAGIRIVAPMYAIETVAAGGGSICSFDGQRLTVGPASAGADPGPACYGNGGPLTVTDINLFNGKIDATQFPFALDLEAVTSRLGELLELINSSNSASDKMTLAALADGFTRIANDKMASAIRAVSAAKGYDPKGYPLVAFGGAAGQHACAIAESLDIETVVLHPFAGILSAYGVGLADVRRFGESNVLQTYLPATIARLDEEAIAMEIALRNEVLSEGVRADQIIVERLLDLRYVGEESAITVRRPSDGDYALAFHTLHQQLYDHSHHDRAIEIVVLRVEAIGRTHNQVRMPHFLVGADAKPFSARDVRFNGKTHSTHVVARDSLAANQIIVGPAIITEALSTNVIDPNWQASVASNGDLLLRRVTANTEPRTDYDSQSPNDEPIARDPIQLELFNNHFTQIATQMGITLQRTSLSVNVKERMDFSCALLDADGHLVVNAPHIPVHLGAMSATVHALLQHVDDIQPGDVYATNDPDMGGSHLPDITVMTPVFDDDGASLRFFAASRAHHAEIGGLRPGSAFPFANNLAEEGVVLRNTLIQREGVFREAELSTLLTGGPYPSRSPDDNMADIRAAIAANGSGTHGLLAMIRRRTWPTVAAYMDFIRDAAEEKTAEMIRRLPDGDFTFSDQFDDGAALSVTINICGDQMRIAFEAGPPNNNSLNANPAIVDAAIMYCLRCLINEDIPLNSGVMECVEIPLQPNTMLNPPKCDDACHHVPVVGGNVEVSQKLVDVIFGALGVAAASQGTMNNFVFGNERFGYYETICGGAGAGPTFQGASAVHTHMTNTRLTDAEIMERQFPVRMHQFAIRKDSGGDGQFHGGDGVVREIEFLEKVEVSLLTQRRSTAPFGLAGGGDGKHGRNTLRRAGSDASDTLEGLAQFEANPGDRLTIETPGGGGYGA